MRPTRISLRVCAQSSATSAASREVEAPAERNSEGNHDATRTRRGGADRVVGRGRTRGKPSSRPFVKTARFTSLMSSRSDVWKCSGGCFAQAVTPSSAVQVTASLPVVGALGLRKLQAQAKDRLAHDRTTRVRHGFPFARCHAYLNKHAATPDYCAARPNYPPAWEKALHPCQLGAHPSRGDRRNPAVHPRPERKVP